MFRDQFHLTKKEIIALQSICIFLIKLYVKGCNSAIKCTKTRSKFYSEIDTEISEVGLKKIRNHQWYLSEELIALTFFDDSINNEIKTKMVETLYLNTDGDEFRAPQKNVYSSVENIKSLYIHKDVSNFVSKKTLNFLEKLKINTGFLSENVTDWSNCDSFKNALMSVKGLKVVNDVAERAVKLMEEYNDILTNREEEKQYILQVVKDYRQKFPSLNKNILI